MNNESKPKLKSYGYANGWSETPKEIEKCRNNCPSEGKVSRPGHYNCTTIYECHTCMTTYTVDSSG